MQRWHWRRWLIGVVALATLSAMAVLVARAAGSVEAITPDGGRYKGPMVDGRMHGEGKIVWANGASYEGGFAAGLYAGRGTVVLSSGHRYEGEFKDGMMHGQGKWTMPDGSEYVGQFQGNEFNGTGRYAASSGEIYEGQFKNGRYHGEGKLVFSDGTVYSGGFVNGVIAGKGEQRFKDGRIYRGDFARGKYEGKGRFETADGEVYEGDFTNDALTGKGAHTRKSGGRYEGEMHHWRPHGKGIATRADGTVFEGTFVQGELTGKGSMRGADGSRYDGEFEGWMFHGKGVHISADGDRYEGQFAYNVFDGEGVMTYAKPKPDGSTGQRGTWSMGAFQDKERERQQLANVEQALYGQRALLDRALTGLQAGRPGQIDMYLLNVAGDGGQEVFRREVEFVQQQFDRDFGTRGRSLSLINSRSTVTQAPMATLTSLREALQAVAAKMNREEDILFLFLTSHGSKNHEFTLNQNGMELADLPAKDLAAMLRDTGIRWKVIVVSACYSGGFIAPLQDDNTMVITAARHDRTSFGCADDNDFTYFGRAFFKEALGETADFGKAFTLAAAHVLEWEQRDRQQARKDAGSEDKKTATRHTDDPSAHSLPQIHQPAAIRRHLDRWRAPLQSQSRGGVRTP